MKLEVCIDSIESARAAISGGADRIEVCGSLHVGGITPSCGLVEKCVALGGVEVVMMIRPHAGGFCYGPDEISTIMRDILAAKSVGVQGVVFGALQADGRVDRELCVRLIDAARPLSVTFHRAFDLTANPLEALDILLGLNVDRLLTSGQAARAIDGADLIRELVRRAGNSLSVMAGAGIRSQDVVPLVRATGVKEIHASASETVTGNGLSAAATLHSTRVTRQETVRAIVNAMREIEPS